MMEGKSIDVVRGRRLPFVHLDCPVEMQRCDGFGRVAVGGHPDADESRGARDEARLLEQLATEPVERMLALLEEAAGTIPLPDERLDRAAGEEQPALCVLDERAHARRGVRVVRRATAGAVQMRLLRLEVRGAPRTEGPAVEERHLATVSA